MAERVDAVRARQTGQEDADEARDMEQCQRPKEQSWVGFEQQLHSKDSLIPFWVRKLGVGCFANHGCPRSSIVSAHP